MHENLAYQDEAREELIGGRIVAMSPRPAVNHNRVASNIFWIFESYLRKRKCTSFADGTDLYLTEDDRFVPDVMIVCDPDKIKSDGVHGAPDLVVEVLSPSTAKNDRAHKKDVYERCGVREYWIVNPADKTVEQYLLRDGRFSLHDAYSILPEWMLAKMKPEEREKVAESFRCSLYDDLLISLEDVFARIP